MGFLCLHLWDGLQPYFLQQIGHVGDTGFTQWFSQGAVCLLKRCVRCANLGLQRRGGVLSLPGGKFPKTSEDWGENPKWLFVSFVLLVALWQNSLIPFYDTNIGSSSGSLRSR